MKKFLRFAGEVKSWTCLSFTGAVVIYTLFDYVSYCLSPKTSAWFSLEGFLSRKISYRVLYPMLGLSICITLLQYVFFSGKVIKKMSYSLRMLLFGTLCFGVCVLFAACFGWFWLDQPGHWAAFIGIFLIAFGVFSLGFELYFRVMRQKYDAALGRSQKRQNCEESVNKQE